jgi:pimeloyl-ACP methyl ester carboxylesterase
MFEDFRCDFFPAHVARIERGDVHGEIVAEPLKILSTGHKIGLAIDLYHHTDFPAGVNVVAHQSLAGFALCLLLRGRLSFAAQDVRCPVLVLSSSDDPLVSEEGAQELAGLCNGSHERLPGLGHSIPIEAPELFVDILKRFFSPDQGI